MAIPEVVSTVGATTGNFLDKIPAVIEWFRNAIMKLTGFLNLPNNSAFLIFAGIISLVFAYFFIKQFVVSGWAKFSTILNLILLALLIYLVLVYI